MRWLYSITDSRDMKLNNLWETTKEREARAAAVHGVTKVEHNLATEQYQGLETFRSDFGIHPLNNYQFSSVAQSCATLGDPMDCSTLGFNCISEVIDISPGNLDSSLCFI